MELLFILDKLYVCLHHCLLLTYVYMCEGLNINEVRFVPVTRAVARKVCHTSGSLSSELEVGVVSDCGLVSVAHMLVDK